MSFDLSAAAAEKRTADGPVEEYAFTFGGQDFTLPGTTDLVFLDEVNSRPVTALKQLLGPEQWERLASCGEHFAVDTMALLVNDWLQTVSGSSPGKSQD